MDPLSNKMLRAHHSETSFVLQVQGELKKQGVPAAEWRRLQPFAGFIYNAFALALRQKGTALIRILRQALEEDTVYGAVRYLTISRGNDDFDVFPQVQFFDWRTKRALIEGEIGDADEPLDQFDATGRIDDASIFPDMLGLAPGDPSAEARHCKYFCLRAIDTLLEAQV